MREAFKVHMLNETGKEKARQIAEAFDELAEKLEALCTSPGGGRYLAIVSTKLEEASFFAKKAMAIDRFNQQ